MKQTSIQPINRSFSFIKNSAKYGQNDDNLWLKTNVVRVTLFVNTDT